MPAPDQIGRYRVERRLGSGAFAVVWLAHDDRLHAPVAVKVMAENWAYRLDIRERFLAEARLLRKATGGGVVQVFDIGELDDERPYFVMEYADRGTVADRMTAGPISVAEALGLVAEVTRGVRALHESGVVHRDIKPSNVLLAGGGTAGRERVLVADLGLAKNLAQASGLTVVAGSVGYMAPEQAEPYEGIDARADIYSLGAVLYHLVTGAVPGSPGQVMPPERLRGEVPPELARAITRAMEPDRELRWPTAAAFTDELERLATLFADRTEAPGAVVMPRKPGARFDPWTGEPLAVSGGSVASGASAASPAPAAPEPADAVPDSGASPVPAAPAASAGAASATPSTDAPSAPARSTGAESSEPDVEPSGPASAAVGSERDSQTPTKVSAPTPVVSSAASTVPPPPPPPPAATTPPEPRAGSVGEVSSPSSVSAAQNAPGAKNGSPASPGSPASSGSSADSPSSASSASSPSSGRRRNRSIVIAAALVVLVGGAGAFAAELNSAETASTVRVSDASKRISVEVPTPWATQAVDSGWSPASIGLADKKAPGLTVTEDVKRWQDLTAGVSGVFIGVGGPKSKADGGRTLAEKVAGIEHSGCSYAGSRAFKSERWKGSVRSWSSCDSPGHSLEEIGLTSPDKDVPQVYVQIRCDGDCKARTDDLLRSLRVRGS